VEAPINPDLCCRLVWPALHRDDHLVARHAKTDTPDIAGRLHLPQGVAEFEAIPVTGGRGLGGVGEERAEESDRAEEGDRAEGGRWISCGGVGSPPKRNRAGDPDIATKDFFRADRWPEQANETAQRRSRSISPNSQAFA
jgi:hypothetical protein